MEIIADLFLMALVILVGMGPLQMTILSFGVSVVLFFTVLHLWKHVKEGQQL